MLDTFPITLEFAPVDDADDPFAARPGTQDYLLRSGEGEFVTVTLRWDDALQGELAALRRPDRDPALVQAMGDRLRKLLAPTGWQRQSALAAEAAADGRTVLVTIRCGAAELYHLPWELLTLPNGRHIGALDHVLFRYELARSKTTPRTPSREGGRIIFGWSAAVADVPAGRHQQLIGDACRRGAWPFDPAEDVVPHLTLDTLSAAISAPDVAVLHLLAHGTEAGASAYGLGIDDGDGGVLVLDPGRLRELIAPHAQHLRLVVLCACDSGNAGAMGNRLGSLALALHAAGVATVVASRYPLSSNGSALLTEAFYDALFGGPTSVETALLKARRRLLSESATLDWASVQLHARVEDGVDSRPLTIRPYRGLLAYQPPDARFFFGRDAERTELLADLEALRGAGRPRFLVVAGASGTGKSSMVLAGAVPDLLGHEEAAYNRDESARVEQIIDALRRLLPTYDPPAVRQSLNLLVQLSPGAKSSVSGWRYFVFRPGARPMKALEGIFDDLNVQQGPVLLIVDQFEELFTQCQDPAEREAFAQRLWSFARLPDAETHVIITIRVDYLGQCGELIIDEAGTRLDRIAYDEAHRVFVAQMGPQQLRAAIEEPAHKVGLQLEPGLVERMLGDVEGEPGALPLLSYTLDLLWQSRDGRVLTQAAYDAVGGVAGALHGRADAIVDALNEVEAHQARRLLVRLVAVEDGAWDARRRVRIADVQPALMWHVPFFNVALEALVDARLLVRGQEGRHATIELAHEALIRRWNRLREWIAADQAMLAQVGTVERWAEEYRRFGRLLVDDQLGYAAKVRLDFGSELSEPARELIEKSEAAVRGARVRRRRLTLSFMGLVVVTALVMLGLGIWGLTQKSKAEVNAAEAEEKAGAARRQERRAIDATRVASARGLEQREPLLASLVVLEFAGLNGVDAVEARDAAQRTPAAQAAQADAAQAPAPPPAEAEPSTPASTAPAKSAEDARAAETPPPIALARRLASHPVPVQRLGNAQVVRDGLGASIHFARSGEVLSTVNGVARVHAGNRTRRLRCGGGREGAVVHAAFAQDGQSGAESLPVALLTERGVGAASRRRLCALGTDGVGLGLALSPHLPRPTTLSVERSGAFVAAIWDAVDCSRVRLVATPFEAVSDAVGYARTVAEAVKANRSQRACGLVARWSVSRAEPRYVTFDAAINRVDVRRDGRQAVLSLADAGVEVLDLADLKSAPLEAPGVSNLRAARYADDGERVIAQGDGAVQVWAPGERGLVWAGGYAIEGDGVVADLQLRGDTAAWRIQGPPARVVVERHADRQSQPTETVSRMVLVDGRRPRVGLLRPGTHWQFVDVNMGLPGLGAPADAGDPVALVLPADDQLQSSAERPADDARVRRPKVSKRRKVVRRPDAFQDQPWVEDQAALKKQAKQVQQAPARRQRPTALEEDDADAPPPPEVAPSGGGVIRETAGGMVTDAKTLLYPRKPVNIEACATRVRDTRLGPRGRYLLVITDDAVCLLPTRAAGRMRRIPVPEAVAVDFRADGRAVAILGRDGSSAIWPVEATDPWMVPETRQIQRVWFPPAAQGTGAPVLYGFDAESTLHRWRMSTDLLDHAPPLPVVRDVLRVSPDGRWAVRASPAGAELVELIAGTRRPLDGVGLDQQVEFSRSGAYLGQITADGVHLWSTASGERWLFPSRQRVAGFEIAPDDARLLTMTRRELQIWDLADPSAPQDRATIPARDEARFSLDGRFILLSGRHTLSRLDVEQLRERFHFEVPPDLDLELPELSPGNRFVVARAAFRGRSDRLLVWQLDGKNDGQPEVIRGEDAISGYQIEGWGFAVRRRGAIIDRPHVVIRSNIGAVERRRLDQFGRDGTMLGHREVVEDLVYHDSGRMVTRDQNDEVRLWLARDGSGATGFLTGQFSSQVLDDGTGQIERATFSPDGQWLVTLTRYGTAWVWRLGWPQLLEHLRTRTDSCLDAEERVRYLGSNNASLEAAACPPPRPR